MPLEALLLILPLNHRCRCLLKASTPCASPWPALEEAVVRWCVPAYACMADQN